MDFLELVEQRTTLTNVESNSDAAFFFDIVLNRFDDALACVKRLNEPIREEKDLFCHFFKVSLNKAVSLIPDLNLAPVDSEKLVKLNSALPLDIKSFCSYVNANSESLFAKISERRERDQRLAALALKEALGHYPDSLGPRAIEDILSGCSLYILADYQSFGSYFKKHKNHFPRLFDGIDNILFYDSRSCVLFLTGFSGPEDMIAVAKDAAKRICEKWMPVLRKVALDFNDPHIFVNQTMFSYYYSLARRYRLPCANELRELDKKFDETIGRFLSKYGEKRRVEQVDLGPAVKFLKETNNPYKFLRITVAYDKREKKNVLFYDRVFSIKEDSNPFVDVVPRVKNPSSDSFPYHTQDALLADEQVHVSLLNLIFLDEQLSPEFANYLVLVANDADKELMGGKGDISFEVAGSLELLANIIALGQTGKGKTPLYQALINGLCENLINTIEKTLRILTLEELRSSTFVDEKDLTLGQMLVHGYPHCLSRNLIKLLQYYLDTDKAASSPDARPGRNLRNKHMHNLGDKYRKIVYGDCLWLFYILMVLFNELELLADQKQARMSPAP